MYKKMQLSASYSKITLRLRQWSPAVKRFWNMSTWCNKCLKNTVFQTSFLSSPY